VSDKVFSASPNSMLDWTMTALPKTIPVATFVWLGIGSSGQSRGSDELGLLEILNNGVTAVLHAMLMKHSDCQPVVVSVFNVLNSLAIFAEHRNNLNSEDIFHLLSTAYSSCLSKHLAFNEGDPLTSDPIFQNNFDSLGNTPNQDSADDSSIRRMLLITLNLTVGTLCLPQPIEIDGLNLSAADQDQDNYSPAPNQAALGGLGMCEMLAESLRFCGKNSLACEPILRALYFLVRNNADNQSVLGDVGLAKLIMLALNLHVDHPRIVTYCLLALSYLALNNESNSIRLRDEGIREVLLRVFNKYMHDAEVIAASCYAVYALKHLNGDLTPVCEFVILALTIHNDAPVTAQNACRAISTLSLLYNNKVFLDQSNVCSIVTSTLNKYASSSMLSVFLKDSTSKENISAAVAQWSCNAIYFIARGNCDS